MIRVALLDALQLKMVKDVYSEIESDIENFKWHTIGYSDDFIWL